jgi:hypothetical protein
MQTQEVPPGYDLVVPTKPKTKFVKRGMKERSKSGFRKITIGFFGFGPQKPNRNRSVWTGPVRFGSSFFFLLPVWLFFEGKNRTELKMITLNFLFVFYNIILISLLMA